MTIRVPGDTWEVLRQNIIETFTPGTPINETELFAGRQQTVNQLQDIVLEPGRHAVIYGGRGVGKTSIANTFHRALNSPTRHILADRVNCDIGDTFDSLWRKVFRRFRSVHEDGSEHRVDKEHTAPITPDDVLSQLRNFSPNDCPIIILDEFDRIQDTNCKALTADTLKALSDFTVNCTVIIVGVARSITELISSHASITRAIVQVPMQRMSREELQSILTVRSKRLGITFENDALWRITFLSAGLPFFTHSLGKHSALLAVAARRSKVTELDVFSAMKDSLADIDYSMRESYVKATEKIYRKANIFPQVLAACALADMDALGRFAAADVEAPLSDIAGREMKTSAFGFHLNELSRPERGALLEKSGERRTFRFQFTDPRMQPFVVMQSLSDGIIDDRILMKFTIRRQRDLPISP